MHNFIVALAVIAATLNMSVTPEATIDRIEDGNIAVVEVYDPQDESIYFGDVSADSINGDVIPGAKLPVHAITGRFISHFLDIDGNIYFKFKGGGETWTLSQNELGFIPKLGTIYTLFVSNNGTPDIYDDIFICAKI